MTDLRQVVARAINPKVPNYGVADRVLAALSACIGEDVVEAAMGAYWATPGGTEVSVKAAGIVFTVAALGKAAEVAAGFDNCGTDSDPRHTIPCEIAAAIRALKSGGRDRG